MANDVHLKPGMGGKTSRSERRDVTATLKRESKKARRTSARRMAAEELGLSVRRDRLGYYYE